MRLIRIAISIVSAFLGLLAFMLGLIAESRRVKESDVTISTDGNSCSYEGAPAYGLGIAGSVFILLAQIIANAGGGSCVCCCDKYHDSRSSTQDMVATLSLALSWTLSVVSFLLLLIYGIANGPREHATTTIDGNQPTCPIPASGGLAAGAVLALMAAVVGSIFEFSVTPKQGPPQEGEYDEELPSVFTVTADEDGETQALRQ